MAKPGTKQEIVEPPAAEPSAPTPTRLQDLLEASHGEQRKGKHLVMGARRAGGQLVPVLCKDTQAEAEAVAEGLLAAGFHTIEVYVRVADKASR
jgi:hypothetical protein